MMGHLWRQLEENINNQGGRYKIGQNGPKGKVFVADNTNDEVWVVFRISQHGGEQVVEVDADACKACGVSEEHARDMIDKAKAAANTRAASSSR